MRSKSIKFNPMNSALPAGSAPLWSVEPMWWSIPEKRLHLRV